MSGSSPVAIDLFCGAGGLSLGLELAGFEIVCAIDNDEHATKTYSHNLGGPVETLDMTTLDVESLRIDTEEVDVVAGGPPCPTFSQVGRTKIRSIESRNPETDDRHELYQHFLRVVRQINPPVILLENVPGMRSATNDQGQKVLDVVRSEMEGLGYNVSVQFPDAANFGVPQRRTRTFFIGNKLDKDNPKLRRWTSHREPEGEKEQEVVFPGITTNIEKTQSTLSSFGALDVDRTAQQSYPRFKENPAWREPWVTVGSAILDLPPLSPDGKMPPTKAEEYLLPPFTRYQQWARKDTENDSLTNHNARGQNMYDLSLYKVLGEGVGWIIDDIAPEYHPYRHDVFPDSYRKQRARRPATTILAHISKDGHQYIHPREVRSLTVREAARLQSFPDSFEFPVSRTQAYRNVGNAVPPLLGQGIGSAIMAKLL